jgi:hypothetical protein
MQKILIISYKKLSKIVYKKIFLSLLKNKKIYFIYVRSALGEDQKERVIKKKNIKLITVHDIKALKKIIVDINPDLIICYFIENISQKFIKIYKYLSLLNILMIKILEPTFLNYYGLIKYFFLNLFSKKLFCYDFGIFSSISTEYYFYTHKFKNKIFFFNNNYFDFFNLNKKIKVSKNYCVFLDENLPLHPDIKIKKNKFYINYKKYYSEMIYFFKILKKNYNIDVIIAGHPSTKKNYFKNFKFIKNKTAELVKNSKFVIMHQSSSIDYAILFKKKILLITSNDINNRSRLGIRVKMISSFFKKSPYNISKNINSQKINKFIVNYNPNKYLLYKSLFIKHPQNNVNNFYDLVSSNVKIKKN